MSGATSEKITRTAGLLIGLMVIITIMGGIWPGVPSWVAGIFAWTASGLLLHNLSRAQKIQITLLLGVGFATILLSIFLGGSLQWKRLLDSNTALLTMLAAVSFLRLIALLDLSDDKPRVGGTRAFRETMMGVALLGGFINISAPVLIGDRLFQEKNLDIFVAKSISRVFTGGVAWSPIFAGMAVVLTYISEAKLLLMMAIGLPYALFGLVYVILEAQIFHRDQLKHFKGYPMTATGLKVPVILATTVLLFRFLLPRTPILIIIALAAVTVILIILIPSFGIAGAARQMKKHTLHGLPGMVGELSLFLGAGVLAVGLRALINALQFNLPLEEAFGPGAAWCLLAAIVLFAAAGVHPVISIAVTLPLLAPFDPNPQLLAITYVFAWSLGTCVSPLSAINLIIQGRYGIPSIRVAAGTWPFGVVMLVWSYLLLQILAFILGL